MTSTTKETEPAKIGSANAWIEYFVDPNNRTLFAICCRTQSQRKLVLNISALTEAYRELRWRYTGLSEEFRPTKHRAEVCAYGKVTDDELGNRLVSPRELAAEFVRLINDTIARKESSWANQVDVVVR